MGPGPDADLATTTFPVDLDRALAVADETVPGGVVTKIELEYDDGVQRYSFDIRTSGNATQDVDVDVDSGVATKS